MGCTFIDQLSNFCCCLQESRMPLLPCCRDCPSLRRYGTGSGGNAQSTPSRLYRGRPHTAHTGAGWGRGSPLPYAAASSYRWDTVSFCCRSGGPVCVDGSPPRIHLAPPDLDMLVGLQWGFQKIADSLPYVREPHIYLLDIYGK